MSPIDRASGCSAGRPSFNLAGRNLPECCPHVAWTPAFAEAIAADSCGSRRDRAAPSYARLYVAAAPGTQDPARGKRLEGADERSTGGRWTTPRSSAQPGSHAPHRRAKAIEALKVGRASPAWRRPSGPSPMVPGGCSPPTDGAALDLDRRRGRGGRGHLIPVIHSAGTPAAGRAAARRAVTRLRSATIVAIGIGISVTRRHMCRRSTAQVVVPPEQPSVNLAGRNLPECCPHVAWTPAFAEA